MSVIDQLACSLGRRDEQPNVELGQQIAARNDSKAVKELVEHLGNRNKDIQNDCIKVLYEAGGVKPELISPYADVFIGLVQTKNNRLQWGAMHALYHICDMEPKTIYDALPKLADAAEKGSVITRDNYVGILAKLGGIAKYNEEAFELLNEQLLSCPTNQLPMYAEYAFPIINKGNSSTYINTLNKRMADLEKESQRKRVEKLQKKLSK